MKPNEVAVRKQARVMALTTALGLAIIIPSLVTSAATEDEQPACHAPEWDTHADVGLFTSEPTEIQAASGADGAPRLEINRLYLLRLSPTDSVHFAKGATGRSGGKAGLVSFSVATPGLYRITLDTAAWIDVVAPAGDVLEPSAFHGWHGCALFRKSLQFDIKSTRTHVLQLSGTDATQLRLALHRN
jgi:hypothetical protein